MSSGINVSYADDNDTEAFYDAVITANNINAVYQNGKQVAEGGRLIM